MGIEGYNFHRMSGSRRHRKRRSCHKSPTGNSSGLVGMTLRCLTGHTPSAPAARGLQLKMEEEEKKRTGMRRIAHTRVDSRSMPHSGWMCFHKSQSVNSMHHPGTNQNQDHTAELPMSPRAPGKRQGRGTWPLQVLAVRPPQNLNFKRLEAPPTALCEGALGSLRLQRHWAVCEGCAGGQRGHASTRHAADAAHAGPMRGPRQPPGPRPLCGQRTPPPIPVS